ncbi:MAG: PorP/SprF family type IX secretion system membrane protein [Cytophagaceae bacterium]
MRFFFTLLFICFATISFGQDIHLTQYYTSNLSLNPAFTGFYNGDVRLTANYRSQWRQVSSSIKTNMFSIEKKFARFNDEIGVGFIVMKDYLNVNHLNINRALLSISAQKEVNDNFFRLGLQAGVTHRTINYASQTFPDQWDYPVGDFNQSLSSGEPSIQSSRMFPDINAGAGWTRRFGNKKVTVGYALFHMNKPRYGFINRDQRLPFRHVINSSVTFNLADQIFVRPHLLYMRASGATDLILGTNVGKRINKDVVVMGGLGFRGSTNSDACLAIVGLTYKRIDFGFSYDFNISELSKDSRNKSAIEFSLIYTTPSRIPHKITLPCDRY